MKIQEKFLGDKSEAAAILRAIKAQAATKIASNDKPNHGSLNGNGAAKG